MKKVPLTQGKFALVDNEDYVFINQWKWYACKSKKRWYARRNRLVDEGTGAVLMHREILGLRDAKIQTDHWDNNGLNNQRRNLRICDTAQNVTNQPKSLLKGNTSKYKGVNLKTYPCGTITWIAQICVKYKKIHIGCFRTQKAAARAYNVAALNYHKDFAQINKLSKHSESVCQSENK